MTEREIGGVIVGRPVRVGGTLAGAAVRTGGSTVGNPVLVPGGTGAGPSTYTHHQDEPSTVWVVSHGLGRRPVAWSLYDDQGRECSEYVVDHPEVNRAVVRMDQPTAGRFDLI